MIAREHRIRDLLLRNQPERPTNFWRWLDPENPTHTTKQRANKFLLGCMVDYRKKSELVWRDVGTYAEKTLGDPESLWMEITKTSELEWKTLAHHLRCSLHPLRNRHNKVWDMATTIVNRYDGDAREIWKNQNSKDTQKIGATRTWTVVVKDDRRRTDRYWTNTRSGGFESGHAHQNGARQNIRGQKGFGNERVRLRRCDGPTEFMET